MCPKLVDVMNCIRKMNSHTTSFTYSLAMVVEVVVSLYLKCGRYIRPRLSRVLFKPNITQKNN